MRHIIIPFCPCRDHPQRVRAVECQANGLNHRKRYVGGMGKPTNNLVYEVDRGRASAYAPKGFGSGWSRNVGKSTPGDFGEHLH